MVRFELALKSGYHPPLWRRSNPADPAGAALAIVRRFAQLNLPERLDAILLGIEQAITVSDAAFFLWSARPWSDGPALRRLLGKMREDRARRSNPQLPDAIEIILDTCFLYSDHNGAGLTPEDLAVLDW